MRNSLETIMQVLNNKKYKNKFTMYLILKDAKKTRNENETTLNWLTGHAKDVLAHLK